MVVMAYGGRGDGGRTVEVVAVRIFYG